MVVGIKSIYEACGCMVESSLKGEAHCVVYGFHADLIDECVLVNVFCCCGEGVSMLSFAFENYVFVEIST